MLRVLIADDDTLLLRVLSARIAALGAQVDTVADGLSALLRVAQTEPDLLIVDLDMPGARGLSVASTLRADPRFGHLPIVVLTGSRDQSTLDQCEAVNAVYIHKGSDPWAALRSTICHKLGIDAAPNTDSGAGHIVRPAKGAYLAPQGDENCSETCPPRVLVIDDDFTLAKTLKTRLESLGLQVTRAYTGRQGYLFALKEQPDVIITDYNMPEGRADYLMTRLRQHESTRDTPVIVLSGFRLADGQNHALERSMTAGGAHEFLTKPPNWDEVVRTLKKYVTIGKPPTKSR